MVARIAAVKSRRQGLAAAVGMGLGGVIFAGLALFGLQAILAVVPSLYVILKIMGGFYLCYLGFRIYKSANEPLEFNSDSAPHKNKITHSFLTGLVTHVCNPKTAIVYASVFAAFLPSSISTLLGLSVLILVFTIEAGWYSVVAVTLSTTTPRKIYLKCKAWIDRGAGIVLGALGLKLVTSNQLT